MTVPAYLKCASSHDLSAAGTLLRFNKDNATHGLVVGKHDGKIILFTGLSRSDVLNCDGEQHCWLLNNDEFLDLNAIYDGKIKPPSRVVSVEGQTNPKTNYDPKQPGQYFYIERPKEEAPSATPVDESALPEFVYQQNLPVQKDKKQPSVMPKLRNDLNDPQQMSKALAIHIYQLEELHKQTSEFASGVNASMDYVRRGTETIEHKGQPTEIKQLAPFTHRDPSGHSTLPEKRIDFLKAQKALVLLDKVRSGLETTGLLVVQFRNVVYELKKEIDYYTIFSQHPSSPSVMKYRDWAMTYDEFAREWSLKLVKERRQLQDAASALQKAWNRYRAKTALYVQRLVTRYAQFDNNQVIVVNGAVVISDNDEKLFIDGTFIDKRGIYFDCKPVDNNGKILKYFTYTQLFQNRIKSIVEHSSLPITQPKYRIGDVVNIKIGGYLKPVKVELIYLTINNFLPIWKYRPNTEHGFNDDFSENDVVSLPEPEGDTVIAQKNDIEEPNDLFEIKIEVDSIVEQIQDITSGYDDYSEWVDRFALVRNEEEVDQPMLAAASNVFYIDRFEDAEPIFVKSAKLIYADNLNCHIFESDSFRQIDRGMLVTAQAEKIRRKKRNQPIIPIEEVKQVPIEDFLVPIEAPVPPVKTQQPSIKQPKVPPGMQPVSKPPNQVGDKPEKLEQVEIKGRPVPIIQPKQLVKQPQPPAPTRILPPIPVPAEQEPVDFSDIPESEWKTLNIPEKIRMAAVFRRIILMEYMKITPPEEGVQKNYLLEVYSYRVKRPRRTNGTPVWYLYCHDINDGHIKAFILKRIKNIEIVDEKYEPRWEVEFAFNPQWNKYKKLKKQKPNTEVELTDQPFFE